jgi:alpha-glucuronidase
MTKFISESAKPPSTKGQTLTEVVVEIPDSDEFIVRADIDPESGASPYGRVAVFDAAMVSSDVGTFEKLYVSATADQIDEAADAFKALAASLREQEKQD